MSTRIPSDAMSHRQSIRAMLCIAIALVSAITFGRVPSHGAERIESLSSIDPSHPSIKLLRDEVRRSIFVVKSRRDPSELPPLRFYRYRLGREDSFWKLLAKTSQNIDTLMTVNSLSSPGEASPGKLIYIPNMRGIIYRMRKGETIADAGRRFQVDEAYISRINGESVAEGNHIFIPCASATNVERSLFLGTAFMHPLRTGRLSSGFGLRRDPFSERSQFHRGIDIACPTGTRIHAARQGKVVFTGFDGGYGLLIVLRHSHGYCSYYGHLSRILKREGDLVEAGELIALSGNTGRTTGPHLHFEARRGTAAVNPGVLLRALPNGS